MLEAGLVALMAPLGKLPDGACAVRAEERVSEPRGRGIPSAAVCRCCRCLEPRDRYF